SLDAQIEEHAGEEQSGNDVCGVTGRFDESVHQRRGAVVGGQQHGDFRRHAVVLERCALGNDRTGQLRGVASGDDFPSEQVTVDRQVPVGGRGQRSDDVYGSRTYVQKFTRIYPTTPVAWLAVRVVRE